MASELSKAAVKSSIRYKAIAIIGFYSVLALFSAVMAIYDIAIDNITFGVLFLLAMTILVILILIKGNTVFGTSVKSDGNMLYLKSWENGFMPYNTDGGFFSDLKPAKTVITEIPCEDISLILIGTKDYIKRNMTESGKKFTKAIYPFEHSSRKSRKNMLSAIDLMYVETKDSDCTFICGENYEPKYIAKIIGDMYKINPDMIVKVNSREYKRHIMKLQGNE